MSRAQRLPVDQRRTRLLQLGLELFSQRPYEEVSTDDIALAGGISKGLLYHYFRNKRGYYVATIRELADRVIATTDLEEGVPFERAIRGALEHFVAFIRDNGIFYKTLMQGGGLDEEVQQILDDARQTMVRRVLDRAGIHEVLPVHRVAFFGWSGFTEAACLHWLEHEEEMPEQELIDMLLGALLLLIARATPPTG